MLLFHKRQQKFVLLVFILIFSGITSQAQKAVRTQPTWWFGGSGAANFNFYRGTTQKLNNEVTVPAAFHKGDGVKPYFSLLTEYRPNKRWGGMLNIAYDNRGGKFDNVVAPCDCEATLSTNISYIAIEPSIRYAPFASAFYLFAGPTISFNKSSAFIYTQEKQTDKKGDWSDIKKTRISAQAGAGIDIPISAPASATQTTISPFVSFQTDFIHEPRTVESWSFYTVRTGIAIKFGTVRKPALKAVPITDPAIVPSAGVKFSVRAPKAVADNRNVKETFPLRNSVFFDLGSAEIPSRYIKLSNSQANSFKEEQLQQNQPNNLSFGRSSRQLAVYHNILNIVGSRLRSNPASAIKLTGSSDKNPSEGKLMAENIRQYLISVFGINPSRITTAGRDKPLVPSEQPGATKDLVLLHEGDRRVDIESNSPELLLQVGGTNSGFFKPVQITAVQADPMDSHVIFNAAGANELLKSWSVEVTDAQGNVQRYGPYSKDQASIPGKTILGNNVQGDYKIVMIGETTTGQFIKEETNVHLTKIKDPIQEGLRYSILFDFDKSKTIASYEKFLVEYVVPLISENGTVIIHGHTDIIGDEKYNHTLSDDRAKGVQQIIQLALAKAGKKGVKFETNGFGEDDGMAPFENKLPEERFYNRTVIIDIISGK